MYIYFHALFAKAPLKAFVWMTVFCLLCGQMIVPGNLYAQTTMLMPEPGMMIGQSAPFVPPVIKGISIHPEQPFYFDFLVDKGDSSLEEADFKNESVRLIKYFMASLAVPENDLWVNLSPHEKDRIIPEEFGLTDMGRDLLAQDYLLKQFTASLMYPENDLGKEFWNRIYKKAYQEYGTTDIPMDTFNKVWILPEKAVIYEQDNTAFIIESSLKVMLEEDYRSLGAKDSTKETSADQSSDHLASDIVREILLPEIKREVNEGRQFAKLRQIYHSLILATWYKENMQQSLINQVYSDRNKIAGIDIEDKLAKNKIYNQYLEAFKKGVYNYIREDYDQYKNQIVPRHYFSGGMKIKPTIIKAASFDTSTIKGDMAMISTRFDLADGGRIIDEPAVDQAQTGEPKEQTTVAKSVRLTEANELYAEMMGQLWDPLTKNQYSRQKFADIGRTRNEQWKRGGFHRYRSLPAQLMLYTWYNAQERNVINFEENLMALIESASAEEKLKAYWARGIEIMYHLRNHGNHPENFEHEYLDHYLLQNTIRKYLALLIDHDVETIPMEYLWGLIVMLDPIVYHPHFLKDNWWRDAGLELSAEQAWSEMQSKSSQLMLSLSTEFDQDKLNRLIQRAFDITPEQWNESGFRSPYSDYADHQKGFFFLFRKIDFNPEETLDQIFLLARSRAYINQHVTFVGTDVAVEMSYLFPRQRAIDEYAIDDKVMPKRQKTRQVTEKLDENQYYYYQQIYGSESFKNITGVKFEFAQTQPVHETNDYNEIRDMVVAWHNRGLPTMYMTKMTKDGGIDLNTYWKNLKLFYIGDRVQPKSILIAGTNYPDGNMLHIEFMATDPQFEGRGYVKKLLATIVERYGRNYEIGGVFLFDNVEYLKEIGFKYEKGEYRYSLPDDVEPSQQKDEAMIAVVDQFIEHRAGELKRLMEQSPVPTADKARLLSLQWRLAIMKEWYDGETIVHTNDQLGEIGERLNELWKQAGFDRYGSWPAQMMLLNIRQLTEDKYFTFVEKQEALISRATRREKLTAYWLNGVKYVSHLRYYGNHPESHFQRPYADNEILVDVAQKYISLLTQEDLDSLPLEYLWGLVAMLDPFVHHPDFRLDNWDDDLPTANMGSGRMNDYILRIFEGLKGVDQEKLKTILVKAFGITDQQWAAAGYRSPYVEFAGFNFNLTLGDMFNEFYLKSDSAYTLDQVFLLARTEQFFLDNFNFVFNTRDYKRIIEFLFSNKRYEERRKDIQHIFTKMDKTMVLEQLKKDPRYYYKFVFGSESFQTATGLRGLGDILGNQKDAAILGKKQEKPTDEAIDRFISSSQIGEFFDLVDSIDLPQRSRIKMIGAAETPQLGMAFALNGYDVQSITLDLKGTTVEATYQELLSDNIEAAGGHYRVFADTNYLDLPAEETAPAMIAALNVLDDPKTISQDKIIEKMFTEVADGGYLVFDFVLNKEYWYNRIEAYARQNGYSIETLYRMPIKGTVYKVTAKLALADAAMLGLDHWEKVKGVNVLRGGRKGHGSTEEEILGLVTEDGKFTNQSASKREVHRQGLWHMTSHIYIFDSRGRLLLQKRSQQKSSSPGKLQVSVSGHVNAGESPKQAALREGQEEVGILLDELRLRQVSAINAIKRSYVTEEGPNNEFTTVYVYTVTDDELTQITKNYNLNESDELWLVPLQTFEEMARKDPGNISQTLRYITTGGKEIYTKITKNIAGVTPAGEKIPEFTPTNPKQQIRDAERLLADRLNRPMPGDALKLSPDAIKEAAGRQGLPINDLDAYIRLHKTVLPLLANKLKAIIEKHEIDRPTYVIISRDGDMIYDAMMMLADSQEMTDRIKLVNIILRQVDRFTNPDSPFFEPQQKENMLEFLAQEGLSRDDLLSGHKFVFIDSAYRGSIFDYILQINGITREEMENHLKGYLVFRDQEKSSYEELPWGGEMEEELIMQTLVTQLGGLHNQFAQYLGQGGWERLSTQRKINWMIAIYLQIQPKYMRNANSVQLIDGKWHSLNKAYADYYTDLEPMESLEFHNPHQVDPLGALILQSFTTQYFKNEKFGITQGDVDIREELSFEGQDRETGQPEHMDEAMFAFLRKNYRVVKRAMGSKEVTLVNLKDFIGQKLRRYTLTNEWTRISDLDENDNEIVRRAVFEWMRLKGMVNPSVTYNLLKNRLYVRNSDRGIFFRKEYAPNAGRFVITGGLEDIDLHEDFNSPVREALGVFLGQKLNVNTTETVVTPEATFSRFMMDGDEHDLPQPTMQGAESSALVLHVFIRNSNDVKIIQRSLLGNTFVKFDFDQGFNSYFTDIERLVNFYIGVSGEERAKFWENWYSQDFDTGIIRETIQKVKDLNLDQIREEFIQSLPAEFDRDIVRRKIEPYFALLRSTQTTIDQDVARMYRFFTSVDLPPINQEEDNAAISKEVGGIDFTSNQLDLEIHRDQNGLPIPLSDQQLQNIQINGLVPVIIQIQPITQLPLLIGTSKAKPQESSPITSTSVPREEASVKEKEYFSNIL